MIIQKVIRWTNNVVMVFNERGKQVPKLQGMYRDVISKVLKATNDNTIFEVADWDSRFTKRVKKELF